MFRHKLIATACGMGYSPIAPGTVGAMFGVLLWLPLFVWTSAAVCSCVTLAAIIACFWLGVRSTDALTPQELHLMKTHVNESIRGDRSMGMLACRAARSVGGGVGMGGSGFCSLSSV